MLVRDINGRLLLYSDDNISKFLSKKEWASIYRKHIMILYTKIQGIISRDHPNIKWDTETIVEFIDLLFENSTGDTSPFI